MNEINKSAKETEEVTDVCYHRCGHGVLLAYADRLEARAKRIRQLAEHLPENLYSLSREADEALWELVVGQREG